MTDGKPVQIVADQEHVLTFMRIITSESEQSASEPE